MVFADKEAKALAGKSPPAADLTLEQQITGTGRFYDFRRMLCRRVVEASWFTTLTTTAIVFNTILLSITYWGMSDAYNSALDTGNAVLTFYFVGEMLIKLTVLGTRLYVSDPMNQFDAVSRSSLFFFAAYFSPFFLLLPASSFSRLQNHLCMIFSARHGYVSRSSSSSA